MSARRKYIKKVGVDPVDLYRFLVESNRYGFTRNNHLMPAGAFNACRDYLPDLYEADVSFGLAAAKQLAEEAIEQLSCDWLREDKRKFVVKITGKGKWEDHEKFPELRFSPSMDFYVFDEITVGEDAEVWVQPYGQLGKRILSFSRNPDDGTFKAIYDHDYNVRYYARLYTKDKGNSKDGEEGESYISLPSYTEKFKDGDVVHVMVRRHEDPGLVDVKLYMDFIDYCLGFLNEHGDGYPRPYNVSDYDEYKTAHGIESGARS